MKLEGEFIFNIGLLDDARLDVGATLIGHGPLEDDHWQTGAKHGRVALGHHGGAGKGALVLVGRAGGWIVGTGGVGFVEMTISFNS